MVDTDTYIPKYIYISRSKGLATQFFYLPLFVLLTEVAYIDGHRVCVLWFRLDKRQEPRSMRQQTVLSSPMAAALFGLLGSFSCKRESNKLATGDYNPDRNEVARR
jgi:hypothetical protein